MKRFLLVIFVLLGAGMRAFAGSPPIHFTASISPTPAHPGEIVTVTVKAAVDLGWHIYSVVPAANGPVATEIVSIGDATPAGMTSEDAPKHQFDDNFGRDVAYHENTATFQRQFRIAALPAPVLGSQEGSPAVTIHYQTCNDKVCLPPTNGFVPVSFSITPGPVRPQYAKAADDLTPPLSFVRRGSKEKTSPALSFGRLGSRAAAGEVPSSGSSSLGLFLLAALGAGLLAIITPCVFPLIPITLTSFVKQANGDQAKLVRLASSYALGIVALYVALGAVVTATFGAAGINRVAANPWVNLGIFVVFVIFALSFFETITLQLPANLSALQATARAHGGMAGLLLLGVTFVLASFTCTAPFIGTLLVAAAGGEKFRPLLGTLVFALAFVSPFLLFAAFPQWIARIPKSGLWLARVKATLGFLELAAALKFLSNADQVWQWKLLTQPVLLAAWAVIAFCAALYLWGTLRFGVVAQTEPPGARVPASRGAFAALFLFFALYCFWGLTGRPLSPYLGAFLPPEGYGSAAVASADIGLPWLSDYDVALAQAKAENKPILIDFTGYTCTNCRLNEKRVFPKPEVQAQFARYVRVQLYTDGGKDGPKNQSLEQEKFGDVALPLYGVINPQTGAVVDKIAGVVTPSDFTHFLSRSLAVGTSSGASRHLLLRKEKDKSPVGRLYSSLPLLNKERVGVRSSWSLYTPAAVAQAAQSGKPILIDFTAAWCVNCKEIEHDVFENPAVAPTLSRDFVTLRADLTQWSSPASVALQKRYGFGSLPTIVLLNPAVQEIRPLRITGRLSVADFQHRLRQASR